MEKDRSAVEQKAENKDLEAQALVDTQMKKGIYIFRAQELLTENQELFLKKDYSKIFRNIQRIQYVIEREQKSVPTDQAEYQLEWMLLLLPVLQDHSDEDNESVLKQSINSINQYIDQRDYKSANIRASKALNQFMTLEKDVLLDWFRGTVVDLNLRVDNLMDLLKSNPSKFKSLQENPMDVLRNYLEEVMTLIAYEDVSSIKTPVLRSYSYIWQIRRFFEQYEDKAIPQDMKQEIEELTKLDKDFINNCRPLTKKFDVAASFQPAFGMLKRIEEDYSGGFITRPYAKKELEKIRNWSEKKRQQVHAEVALEVSTTIQKKIDKLKAADLDVSLSQAIFDQLQKAFGDHDYAKAQVLLNDVKKSISDKRNEKLREKSIALITPVEAIIESIEEQGIDVGPARELLASALDHLEKNEFDQVKRCVLEAKQMAKNLKANYFQKEVKDYIDELQNQIEPLRKEGKDMAKVDLQMRQAKMMLENNNLEKSKEYIQKVEFEIKKLKLGTPAPPPQKPKSAKHLGRAKPSRELKPEEKEIEARLNGRIIHFNETIALVQKMGGDPTYMEKFLTLAKEELEFYDFKKAEEYLDKCQNRSRKIQLDTLRALLDRIKAEGVETEYLGFIIQQCADAYNNKQWAEGDEMLESIKETVKEFVGGCKEEPQEEPEDTSNVCSKCGNEITSDDVFCSKCGNKVG